MSVSRARSRLANATKKAKSEGLAPGSASAVVDARRDLAEAKIRELVTKTVAAAPPLTEIQRARLAALLLAARR